MKLFKSSKNEKELCGEDDKKLENITNDLVVIGIFSVWGFLILTLLAIYFRIGF